MHHRCMQGTMSTKNLAPTDAAAEAVAPAMNLHSTTSHANIPEIMASLPVETRCPPFQMRHYAGFWMPELLLKGIAVAHACFEPRPSDVFLVSFPKSGTTWLKALAFSTLNRATHSPFDGDHPLHHCNPHDCVDCLEVSSALVDSNSTARDLFAELPSPRLLAAHTPYSLLPHRITEEGSGCRLVYICRDPKDALVSFFHFGLKIAGTLQPEAGQQSSNPATTFEEAFELFSDGRCMAGPQWRHAREYWEESQRRPGKVLFLRYEEMFRDPVGNLKNLAAFMGCAFSEEEEEAGVVHKIVELCSLEKLKSLDVNKNGSTVLGVKNDTFFRKGCVGDWRNHMTPEMAARLDKIVEEALQGSGLSFASSV